MIIVLSLSTNVFAVTQIYPTDYTYIDFPGYGSDYFANWTDTDIYKDTQSYYASRIFAVSYNTTATPLYTNLWGTFSKSRQTAHEGIDMVYGTTGQPIKHWGSNGTVTVVDSNVGLVGIYSSSINETIFYRHLNSIATGLRVGSTVSNGAQIGTQGQKGNATGVHLHTGVEWGNTAYDSTESYGETSFTSQNPYYAMQLFGY